MHYARYFTALANNLEALIVAGGYPVLFLLVFFEGMPLIGTAVPGHVALVAAGFLVKIGVFGLYPVLILSVAAALLGDFAGFLLGRKYGMGLIDRLRPYFFITHEHIAKARKLLDAHTGKAMIIGRFSPMTRALTPFLVGAGKVPAGKFWLFNAIGGASWAVLSVVLGYAFGAGYHLAAGYLGRFIVIAVVALILILWGYRFVNARFHIFRRYELFVLALNAFSLLGLAKVIQDATVIHPRLVAFDVWVYQFMASVREWASLITPAAVWVTNIGSTAVTGGLGLVIGVWLAVRQKWRSAAIMLLSVASSAFFTGLMKDIFRFHRPPNALVFIDPGDWSLPSGHAALAAAFFAAAVYLLAPKIHSWVKRELMIVASVLIVFLVGLSRIVLNAHWTSDVVAGWALGLFCATGSILLVRYVGALFYKRKDR